MREGAFLDHMEQMIVPAVETYLLDPEDENNVFFKCYISVLPEPKDQEEIFTVALFEYDSKMPSVQTMGTEANPPVPGVSLNTTVCECYCLMVCVRAVKDLSGEELSMLADPLGVDDEINVDLNKRALEGSYSAARKVMNRIYKHLNGRTNFRPKKVDETGELTQIDSNYIYQYIHAKQPPYQMGIDENERNLLVCNFMVYRTTIN